MFRIQNSCTRTLFSKFLYYESDFEAITRAGGAWARAGAPVRVSARRCARHALGVSRSIGSTSGRSEESAGPILPV
jgi:hypothetical protein